MKALYKIVMFLMVFQLTIVIVNLLGVFPSDSIFYSDIEMDELTSLTNPVDFLAYFFTLPDLPGLGAFTQFTFAALLFIFLGLGALYARATQSWTPVVVAIIATSFVPMIVKSTKFFNKLFYNWNVPALTYLGITIGVGIIFIVLFTIIETPTHGRSG